MCSCQAAADINHNYVYIACNYIVAVPLIRSTFGMGTGMIVEQIRCSGTERRLANCTIRDVTDGECDHNEYAGVRCCKCHDGNKLLKI